MDRHRSSHPHSAVLLCLLLLAPSAVAWRVTVDAPVEVGAGLPFLFDACVDGPPGAAVQLKIAWLVEGRPLGSITQGDVVDGGHRYGPPAPLDASGRVCRTVRVDTPPGEAEARLEVKARPEQGSARATLTVNITARDAPIARIAAYERVEWPIARLRVPVDAGIAFVPLLSSASTVRVDGVDMPAPPPLAWRLVEARRGPLGGFVIENAGPAASLGGLALARGGDRVTLPDIILEPHERILVGPRPAPDVARHLEVDLDARPGVWSLAAAEHALDSMAVPQLGKGESVDANGTRTRQGRTQAPLHSLAVEGRLMAYTTPHAGASPLVERIDQATRSIRGEFYTLTSPDIAHALAAAAARGVETTLLLEGAPAGGVPPEEEPIVAALVAHGVEVSWLRSTPDFPARFRTQHAKVLVIDNATVHIATENPTPRSYPPQGGSRGTRGLGLLIENATLAREINHYLDADLASWPDVQPARLDALPPAAILERAPLAPGPTLALEGRWNVTPIVSPDTSLAMHGLVDAMRSARDRVDVAMLLADARFPEGPNPFLDALVAAAREGARVRLLLDGRYERGEHAATIERFQQLAAREGLSLNARLATPDETLHAKWVGVDDGITYVGSMNWGHAAATKNREMGFLIENETLTRWYGAWFEEEWKRSESGRWGPDAPNEVDAPGAWGVVMVVSFLLRRRATSDRSRPRA